MKIDFSRNILPHLIAVAVFYVITLIVFSPAIFSGKSLDQHDINQWKGSSQELREFREETGEEGLWANSMFSGMPAYLVNVEWNDKLITYAKIIGALGLPHPVRNHFLAFLSFYILLLCFKVNPYLALPGAIAFGLSSYLIVGTIAGHNARIGSIAFMPLVIAGFHLIFTRTKKLPGLALMAAGTAFHLRENHPQITYYLFLILSIYGVVLLWQAVKEKTISGFGKSVAFALLAGILATGTYAGKLWTTMEYSKYSIRGQSELSSPSNSQTSQDGISKSYAFEFSNGIWEPLTLMIPDFVGGSSSNLLVMDRESDTYNALVRAQDAQQAQQLAGLTSSYWGNQRLAIPYYAGALVVFLFALGIAFAKREHVIWLTIVAAFGIILSWGDSFSSFNYFMFDYFPGYNKFRSVTFALILPLLAIPLLGSLGLQKASEITLTKAVKKKFLIVMISTAGLCLLVFILAGLASYSKTGDSQLPPWLLNALREDRQSLLRSDTLRTFGFMLSGIVIVYLMMQKKLKVGILAVILTFLTFIDLYVVDKRYLTDTSFKKGAAESFTAMNAADQQILADKSEYRVYNIQGNAFVEARTSTFHSSVGGYHGAKLRRYQDLYDHVVIPETQELIGLLQGGSQDLSSLGVLNMLNIRYFTFGTTPSEIIRNSYANGPAWLVNSVIPVQSPDEELDALTDLETKSTAVIDASKFEVKSSTFSNSGSIILEEKKPNFLKYKVTGEGEAFAVFSEIYYPVGWTATIDGDEVPILRSNFVLRALEVPAGSHTIEFRFSPASYRAGNSIMLISNILLVLLVGTTLYLSTKNDKNA